MDYRHCALIALIAVCGSAQTPAQEDNLRVPGGECRKLSSNALNEERTLLVGLPEDYASSSRRYPVLYVLDAHQRTWAGIVSLVARLHAADEVPSLILVGVVNTEGNRNRDMLPTKVARRLRSGGAGAFAAFLERELKPFVEAAYRTADDSTIAGFSNSGLFVVYCLVHNPDLFDHSIASSPMLGYARELILSRAAEFLRSEASFNRSLFVVYGGKDPYREALDTTPEFDGVVRSNQPEGFRYESVLLKDEGHVPASSLERGLVWTFSRRGDQHRHR